jgi:hypothetical protein
MTVASTTSKVSYAADGAVTAFPFPFKVLDARDLKVVLRAADGSETALAQPAGYTVSCVGQDQGGTATLSAPPALGRTVVLYRDVALTQELDLANNDPFDADQVEGAFDRLTMIAQQLAERSERALAYAVSTPATERKSAPEYLAELSGLADSAAASRSGAAAARDQALSAQTGAQAAQSAAEAARDAAQASAAGLGLPAIQAGDAGKFLKVNASATGYDHAAGPPVSAAPVLSGPDFGNEGAVLEVSIANHADTLNPAYTVTASAGSFTRTGGTIAWTLPAVAADSPATLSVSVLEMGKLGSPAAVKTVTVLNVPIQDGPTMTFNDDPSGFPDGDFA